MKSANVTLIFAKWWTWLPFLVQLTGDEQSKKGRQKGAWVNYLPVWDWWFIMPEWNLSSLPVDSLINQNQTKAFSISRRSWKQGSDGLVLIKDWLVGTAETPCCCSSEFHCGYLSILPRPPLFLSEAKQEGYVQWQKKDRGWFLRKFSATFHHIYMQMVTFIAHLWGHDN